MELKWRPRGPQMETKMEEFRGLFGIPPQEPSRGGFGEASGWIWGGFGEGFGRIWRPRGAQMETKMEEFRGLFGKPPPGALQGRVWRGFWMDLGTISGGFWTDLEAGGSPNRDKNE